MSNFDDLYGSRFVQATDIKAPVTAVIERMEEESFPQANGKPARPKLVMYVRGAKKGIVINKTNANNLADAFGKNFVKWPGKRVSVRSESTTFGGKAVQGLRVYPAKEPDRIMSGPVIPPEPPPQEGPPPEADPDDGIPWK